MTRHTGYVVLVGLLGSFPAAAAGRADVQDAPQADVPRPRVTLSQSVGPADGIVAVPVQVEGLESRPLGSVTLKIVVPSSLSFTKAEIGGLGISIGAEVKASTERSGRDTIVQVTVAAPETGGIRPPLSDGPIAQLMFKVAKTAKPQTVIPLKFQASGLGVRAADGPVKVGAVDGEIIVANPTVISCFFYMH